MNELNTEVVEKTDELALPVEGVTENGAPKPMQSLEELAKLGQPVAM